MMRPTQVLDADHMGGLSSLADVALRITQALEILANVNQITLNAPVQE
jgi:hypothetical protein